MPAVESVWIRSHCIPRVSSEEGEKETAGQPFEMGPVRCNVDKDILLPLSSNNADHARLPFLPVPHQRTTSVIPLWPNTAPFSHSVYTCDGGTVPGFSYTVFI